MQGLSVATARQVKPPKQPKLEEENEYVSTRTRNEDANPRDT